MREITTYLARIFLALLSGALCANVLYARSVDDDSSDTVTSNATENNNAIQSPLIKESMLLDVAVNGTTVIVGERGHILIADEDGLSQVQVPSTVTLTAVDGKGEKFLAVGHDATILRSSNGGKSWQVVLSLPDLDRPFLDVLFISENEAIAVGGYGLFFRSLDGGETWSQEQHVSLLSRDDIEYLESIADDEAFYQEELDFIFPHFNRLSEHNNGLLLAGEAGLIASSSDFGRSWERYELDYFGSFFDVSTLANNTTIAVGLRGNMFVQPADGAWESIATCVTTSLNAVVDSAMGTYVVGNNGVVFSVDSSKFDQSETQAEYTETCRAHPALTKLDTQFSSTISNAFVLGDALTAVSTTGLHAIK